MIDLTATQILRASGILVLTTWLLGGCGELAFKRGGSASDFEAAQKACREANPEPEATRQCLAEGGWFVTGLKHMDSLGAEPVIEAAVIPGDRRIENIPAPEPARGQARSGIQRTPDPMDTFKVGSWWKAGGSAGSLGLDTDACVARLGEAHRPDNRTQQATRGLLLCLKEKGWSGLRAQ